MGHGPLDDPLLTGQRDAATRASSEPSLESTQPPYRDTELANGSEGVDPCLEAPRGGGIPRAPLVPRFSPYGLAAVPLAHPPLDAPILVEEVQAVESAGTLPGFPAVTTEQPPAWPEAEHLTPAVPRFASPARPQQTTAKEVRDALEAGKPQRALDLADRASDPTDPEIAVLRGQALFALGARQRALAVLAPALSAEAMAVEVRTRLAQLLVELSEPELAVTHARKALAEAPNVFATRLTCAWALIRLSRRTGDESLAREADALLAPSESTPPSARVLSLRAAAIAEHGPATRAVSLAQEALEQDPHAVDALAAVALASKRLGLDDEASHALSQLERLDPAEASVTASALEGRREQKRDEANVGALAFDGARAPKRDEANLGAFAFERGREPKRDEAGLATVALGARAPKREDAGRAAFTLDGPREPKHDATALESTRPPPARPVVAVTAVVETFGEAEGALFDEDDSLARRALESTCASIWSSLPRHEQHPWPKLARAAAPRFPILPVLRHFAPYDCSLFSIERLAAALDLVYGRTRRPPREPVVLVIGSYLGECLRQAYGGDWIGGSYDPASATVNASGLSVAPCERVARRIARIEPLVFEPPARLHPGADPFGNTVPLSIGPPSPWDPEPWPSWQRLLEVGRLLPGSVVGLYCRNVLERELDFSPASLAALDRYVALLAPERAPPDPSGPWVRRAALLLGAYVAELLVHHLGARVRTVTRADGPEEYQLELRDGTTALPVARVFDRLAGRRITTLADYVTRLAEGRALSSYPAPG